MSFEIRPFQRADTDAVVALWRDVGLVRPWNDPHTDIERKLGVQPELFLVAATGDDVVGSVMAGYDGHRGWLYYLAAAQSRRGEGIGGALVTAAERLLTEMGCPKVQLMVRPENHAVQQFYRTLGYEPFEIWTTGKRLISDEGLAPDPRGSQ